MKLDGRSSKQESVYYMHMHMHSSCLSKTSEKYSLSSTPLSALSSPDFKFLAEAQQFQDEYINLLALLSRQSC